MSSSHHINWISNLRVVATIGVVLLHVASTTLYHFNPEDNYNWWTGNIYDSFVRFSVPVFLMITGALMVGKDYPLPLFIRKKFLRIVTPFIFWTGIYIVYNFYDVDASIKQPEGVSNLDWIISQFQNGSSYHLWYIYMLLSLYVLIPIINLAIKHIPKLVLELALIAWMVFLYFYSDKLYFTNFEVSFQFILGYLGYVLLGYYLYRYNINKAIGISLGAGLFIAGFLVTCIFTYKSTLLTWTFDKFYYSYLTLNVAAMASGCFLLFKYTSFLSKSNKVLRSIDSKSYGIYLGHVLLLNFLAKFGIDWFLIDAALGIPITSLLCFIFTYLIIAGIRRVPFGKYISG